MFFCNFVDSEDLQNANAPLNDHGEDNLTDNAKETPGEALGSKFSFLINFKYIGKIRVYMLLNFVNNAKLIFLNFHRWRKEEFHSERRSKKQRCSLHNYRNWQKSSGLTSIISSRRKEGWRIFISTPT